MEMKLEHGCPLVKNSAFTHVRHVPVMSTYLIGVSAVLVFGTVRGIGEGLVAALVLTHIWLFPCVGPQVCLQVLQARVGLGAAFKLEGGGLVRKGTHMQLRQWNPQAPLHPPTSCGTHFHRVPQRMRDSGNENYSLQKTLKGLKV